MHRLVGIERAYPWGSTTDIPALRGEDVPSPHPVAEVWFGAHPAAPSTIDGIPLSDLIAEDPERWLGRRIAEQYNARLPFLVKLLAAAEPLSLQAHPSKEQAEEGWASENAAGLPAHSPQRNYKDNNHKPELLVALTEFSAMAGFRPLTQTLELLRTLRCPALERSITMLGDEGAVSPEEEASRLRGLFTTWITIPAASRGGMLDSVVEALRGVSLDGVDTWMAETITNVIAIAERYPHDTGILGALLLNHVRLQPGDALYLSAGSLHAYLSGLGVEVMANSDNVLRGGLTSKHVDVPELMRVLRFDSLAQPVVSPLDVTPTDPTRARAATVIEYPVPVDDFVVHRVILAGSAASSVLIHPNGPCVVVATEGEVCVTPTDRDADIIAAGYAVWLDDRDGETALSASASAEAIVVTMSSPWTMPYT